MPLSRIEEIALQDSLSACLEDVKRCFKSGSRVTLVVRNPNISDEAGVVIGDDDLDEAVKEIRRRQAAAAK